ncbi:Putative cell-wall binding lipoprotein [Oceanobacillus limi]|uniref:Putative cell-wall binding lipoprotein n=1 Tax=Oceanobacillus limi TaxID=930131 RepID=A0A1I0DA13_9BACI|nr:YkyA family protein [Oceanobacillus limi]SET29117.1 Putative cell-wall binding lipoprotein [Oceanobacillus limi]
MRIKKLFLILIFTTFFILSACGESIDTQVYNHLEKAVSLEEGFEQQQTSINELEKQEQSIYEEIIDLGMDDFEKIQELSNEAISVIDERKEKIELEKNSIEDSREEFLNTEELINEIDDDSVKEKANEMYDAMVERYKSYDVLYEKYMKSLTLEKELYEMLQKEEMDQDTVTEHIETINESYQDVIQANETFNSHTMEYNKLKKEYYNVADITVNYDEDES